MWLSFLKLSWSMHYIHITNYLNCEIATTERSSFKLKIIRSYVRSMMLQEQLSLLSLLYTEVDTAQKIDFSLLTDSLLNQSLGIWSSYLTQRILMQNTGIGLLQILNKFSSKLYLKNWHILVVFNWFNQTYNYLQSFHI